MVHVVGDDAVNLKIPAQAWQDVVALVVAGMKAGRPQEGLADAIRCCGELLQAHFPIQDGDVNQLGDGLVLLD
jgi:putative membrane protein